MADESTLGVSSLAGIAFIITLFLTWYKSGHPLVRPANGNLAGTDGSRLQLDAIPNAGYSGPLLSYFSAFRYGFLDRKAMVKEGYEKVTSSLSLI
jgi:hypothetical protein